MLKRIFCRPGACLLAPPLKRPSLPVRFRSEGRPGLLRQDPKARSSNDLLFFALQQSSPVTLREMIEFGSDPHPHSQLMIGQFLRHELPVRLAHRVRDLKRLPYGLAETDAIQGVIQLYEQSFWRIRQFGELRNSESEKRFCELLADIYQRHNNVQQSIASGLRDVMHKHRKDVLQGEQFDFSKFLDRFYMSRISIRMLISQYVAIHDQKEGYVGIIAKGCRPLMVARDAVDDAQQICRDHYAVAPAVDVIGPEQLSLSFVPSHLYYMFFELLKNSMRAVVEKHASSKNLPNITMVIAEGGEDVSIKISDEGGGIPRSGMNRLWTYSYTTADRQAQAEQQPDSVPMAGFGHGLPLSRLYARYFGGELQVISMEGYGTDAYVHIRKDGSIDEQLP